MIKHDTNVLLLNARHRELTFHNLNIGGFWRFKRTYPTRMWFVLLLCANLADLILMNVPESLTFLFFQISSEKLRARVAILDLRGLKVYQILKIVLARLFQIAILEL